MVNNSPFGLVLVSDAKHVFEQVISGCVERFAPCLRWRIRQFKSTQASRVQHDREEQWPQRQRQIEEYHSLLTKNFLLDYLMPTLVGVKTVLEDLATKNLEVREIRPGDLFETRFLLELKESGSVR